MTHHSRGNHLTTLLPLLFAPLVALALIRQFDAIPALVQGLVTGASIALLLACCVYAGAVIRATRARADTARLDELAPLGGAQRDRDDER
jgi:hypothetical protein